MQVDLVIYRVFCTALFRLSFCLFNCAIVNLTQGIQSNLTSLLSFLSSSFRNYSLLSSLSLLPLSPPLSSLSCLLRPLFSNSHPSLSSSLCSPCPFYSLSPFAPSFSSLLFPTSFSSFVLSPLSSFSPLPISLVPLPRERVCYWK